VSPKCNVILGGAGLIGSALDRLLRSKGEQTIVYDLKLGFDLRLQDPPQHPVDTYYWFLAWDVGGAKYIMDDRYQVEILQSNLKLCERVFAWLRERQGKFTFVSTQMVGYPNAYGVSKSVGEYWAKVLGGSVCRLWNVYGAEKPSLRSHVVPDLIEQGNKGFVRLGTSGEERRQFLLDDDCAEALLVQRESGQRLADITSGEWVSIRDLGAAIARIMNAKLTCGSAPGYESLVDATAPLLGWGPRVGLETGLERVVKRMRDSGWLADE
jgi:nucleoside-diphosphate-sugar epimerase